MVAGAVICAFALVPGLPKLPFLLVGGMFFAVGWSLRKEPNRAEKRGRPTRRRGRAAAPPAPSRPTPRDAALDALALDPLELAIGFGLVPLVDNNAAAPARPRRHDAPPDRLRARHGDPARAHPRRRDAGLARVRDARARHRGRPRRRHGRPPARDGPGDAVGQLAGIPTTEPAFGLPAVWVADAGRAEAEALGWTVVDAESVVVTHLTETIRSHAAELLTRQETRHLLDQLKEVNAAVVEEVVPDVLSLGEVQRVLQSLLREGVSIRDLGAVVEAIGDKARLTRDPAMLAEYARQALGRTIVAPYLDHEGTLRAIALDPNARAGGRRGAGADGRRRVPRDGPVARPRAGRRVRRARSTRRSPAAAARCCSARPACAAICAVCASSGCPSWRSARTTRSRRVSELRQSRCSEPPLPLQLRLV